MTIDDGLSEIGSRILQQYSCSDLVGVGVGVVVGGTGSHLASYDLIIKSVVWKYK